MPPGKSVKAVFDTNTLVSALLGSDSKPAEVLKRVGSGKIMNYTSREMLEELRNVLQRPKITGITTEHERQHFIRIIESISTTVNPKQKINAIKEDPADNRILECALEAKADYIVTGDKHLLKLGKYRRIRVVNSEQMLKKLG